MPRRHTGSAIAILVFLLAGIAAAAPHGPSEREGRRGLVFGVEGESLLAFDDAMVAIRQQIGERTGLRLSLTFSQSGGTEDWTSERRSTDTAPDTSFTQTSSGERSADTDIVDLDVDLLFIRHGRGQHALRFFYGAGPMFGYYYSEGTEASVEESEYQGRTSSGTHTSTQWSYGLRLLVGAEWFLTECVSVHAEYRAGLTFHNRDWERASVQLYEPSDDQDPVLRTEDLSTFESEGWTIGSHGARVGVSLFF